jgi:hypothetical protein
MSDGAKLKRVVFQNPDAKNQEIKIDLIFDGNQVRRGIEYFGVWQDKADESRCPFTLGEDGEADFGTGYDGADRYYETNMLEKEMVSGQQITWNCEGDEAAFSIVYITPLI